MWSLQHANLYENMMALWNLKFTGTYVVHKAYSNWSSWRQCRGKYAIFLREFLVSSMMFFFDDATDAAGEKDSIKPKPLWRRQCIEKSAVKPRTQPRSIPKHMQLARTYLMYWIRQRNPKPLRTRNSMWYGSVFGDNAPDVAVLLLKGCHFWAKLRWTNGTF